MKATLSKVLYNSWSYVLSYSKYAFSNEIPKLQASTWFKNSFNNESISVPTSTFEHMLAYLNKC